MTLTHVTDFDSNLKFDCFKINPISQSLQRKVANKS